MLYTIYMKLNIPPDEIEKVIKTPLETDKHPLTPEEENFIQYYIETLNKRLAYEKAFNNGQTLPFSSVKASELMERPEISQRIAELMQKNLDADVAKSPNLLLKYIERFLELDPAEYYDDVGRIKPFSQLSVEQRLLISNVNKIVNNRTGDIVVTYQLPDKLKLLDQLSKLVTFVAEVRKITDSNNVNKIEEAEKRRNEIFNNYLNVDSNSEEIDDTEITVLEDKINEKKQRKKRKKTQSKS